MQIKRMQQQPNLFLDYRYDDNYPKAVAALFAELNLLGRKEFPGSFLCAVPLGSAIYNWKVRLACGQSMPCVGDLDFGIVVNAEPALEELIRGRCLEIAQNLRPNYGLNLRIDPLLNPAQCYFNVAPSSPEEVNIIQTVRTHGEAGLYEYRLALPFLQDDPEIALLAYQKLVGIAKSQGIPMKEIWEIVYQSIRHFFVPEIKHSGIALDANWQTLSEEVQALWEKVVDIAEANREYFRKYDKVES